MPIIINNGPLNCISKIGQYINSPEQRLIQGVTALMIQPTIDYKNKSVDDDTRSVSVSRTIGKIIAGTLTGVLIRYATIHLAKGLSRYTLIKDANDFIVSVHKKSAKDIFMPRIKLSNTKIKEDEFKDYYNNFISMIGTLLGTFTMLYTNFAWDAPLTKKITQKILPHAKNYILKHKENNNA